MTHAGAGPAQDETASPREGVQAGEAWSPDGRSFRASAPLAAALPVGGYVHITPPDGGSRLGQLLDLDVCDSPKGRQVEMSGILVDAPPHHLPFDGATIAPATDAEVQGTVGAVRNPLVIGAVSDRPDVPAVLDAKGFNRHTFLIGQSGSGKTYALGAILEQLVMHTTLPLLVLDPNGDHVHLGEVRDGVEEPMASRYREAAAEISVLRATPGHDELPLRIRVAELGVEGPGALLGLDPVADREEYNALLHLTDDAPEGGWRSVADVDAAMVRHGGAMQQALHLRLENLGIASMPVWAFGGPMTVSHHWREDRPRAVVADTSGFADRRDRMAVAVSILTQLWAQRGDRRPLLLVVDEAHDVCPAHPADSLQRLAVDLFTRIAGEGRKYGIHLLLASQRPSKLPEDVLSQCDNLVLMRVNAAGDRQSLAARFGFAPAGLVDRSGTFGLGEVLLAGAIARPPVLGRVGRRLTPEGGADVPTDWLP